MRGIFRGLLNGLKPKKKALSLEDYINTRIKNGEDPEKVKKDLLKDLAEGGPIFKDFKEAIKPTFPGSVKRFDDSEVSPKEMCDNRYVWSSVLLAKTCDDCRERHGKIKTMEEWEKEGLSRKAKTKCGKKCTCVLMPAYTLKLKPLCDTPPSTGGVHSTVSFSKPLYLLKKPLTLII